jgi:hypothetical protein
MKAEARKAITAQQQKNPVSFIPVDKPMAVAQTSPIGSPKMRKTRNEWLPSRSFLCSISFGVTFLSPVIGLIPWKT